MTLVAVSSIVRRAPLEEQSSFMRLVDLEARRVVAKVAMPETHLRASDPNPRGGHRGTRGLAAFGDRFVAAASDRLFMLDPSWRLAREVSHPWIGNIHELFAVEDGVWVTSTAASLLVKLSWTGEIVTRWHWAADPELPRALGFRRPSAFDEAVDYRGGPREIGVHSVVHMNAVVRAGSCLLVSLGLARSPKMQRRERRRSAIARATVAVPAARRLIHAFGARRRGLAPSGIARSPDSSHVIVALDLEDERAANPRVLWSQDGVETPKHNIAVAGETLLFNDSDAGELAGVDLATGEVALRIPIPGSPAFARGLCRLTGGEYLIGSQRPAAIHRVSLRARSTVQSIELGGEPREAVHGICEVPDQFSRDRFEGFNGWARAVTN